MTSMFIHCSHNRVSFSADSETTSVQVINLNLALKPLPSFKDRNKRKISVFQIQKLNYIL